MGENKDIQFNITSRKTIEESLKINKTATEIGLLTKHNKSSVSREVKLHRIVVKIASVNASICQTCVKYKTCNKKKICGALACCGECKRCSGAKSCSNYVKINCHIETKWPFVCPSDCKYKDYCNFNTYKYDSEKANKEALTVRAVCRQGLDMSPSDFEKLNATLSEAQSKGQSINHICHNYVEVNRCKSSIYAYIHKKYLSVQLMDLPRAVTYKQRKKVPTQYEYLENKNIDRKGHLYFDWIVYKSKHSITYYWEMDFLGCPHNSKQEILTLACRTLEVLLMFVVDKPNTDDNIIEIFNKLEEQLGIDLFCKVFPAITTDRDSRFNKFKDLELNKDGVKRTHLFYCDPGESNQKPLVENENSQIRIIFPKGTSIEGLTQPVLNIITSNFNSRSIESIENHCSFELFAEIFGIEVLQKLGLNIINPKDVTIKKYTKYK